MGLRLQEQKGPTRAPQPWSQRQGTSPGSLAGFLGSSGWGKHSPFPSCSSGPGGSLPPAPPLLPLASLLCPRDQCGWGKGGLRGQGIGLGAQQAPWARVGGETPSAPLPLLLPASPDLRGLRVANPVWPPLLPRQPRHVLPVHLGFPPISLGVRVPHHRPAVTLVVGRH